MAVAEARKMEKGEIERSGSRAPDWLSGTLGWAPRKLSELKTFLIEVRSELKKVTWPGRNEVQATTVVVILTTIFFGFYLYGLDLLMSQLFTRILRH
jgi:preprotein translocase subunit SecE